MSDYGGVNPSHFCLLPYEDVLVLSQKLGKETSEVVRELGTYVGELFRVIIQRYGLQLFQMAQVGCCRGRSSLCCRPPFASRTPSNTS